MKNHITVLAEEAVEALMITDASVVVDATLGSGGHAMRILEKLREKGIFVGIDADASAIEKSRSKLSVYSAQKHLCTDNFRNIDSILAHLHITKTDAILADLGWRMEQFSGNGRGFSFQVDEPLLMTFGNPDDYLFTARDVVNEWEEEHIKDVLKGYGEERFAGRIANAIVTARTIKPINTTFELVSIINDVVPYFYRTGRIHPATRTFQALRIVVNDELQILEEFIKKAIMLLAPKGRLAIITFQSLEDRIVKHCFKNYAHDLIGYVITKKPITAQPVELHTNPRSRSAKLRIFEKI